MPNEIFLDDIIRVLLAATDVQLSPAAIDMLADTLRAYPPPAAARGMAAWFESRLTQAAPQSFCAADLIEYVRAALD